jgi:hypothetical protein
METTAWRTPVVDGAKVTWIVQVAPVARVAGQLLVGEKSPLLRPVMDMPEIAMVD